VEPTRIQPRPAKTCAAPGTGSSTLAFAVLRPIPPIHNRQSTSNLCLPNPPYPIHTPPSVPSVALGPPSLSSAVPSRPLSPPGPLPTLPSLTLNGSHHHPIHPSAPTHSPPSLSILAPHRQCHPYCSCPSRSTGPDRPRMAPSRAPEPTATPAPSSARGLGP